MILIFLMVLFFVNGSVINLLLPAQNSLYTKLIKSSEIVIFGVLGVWLVLILQSLIYYSLWSFLICDFLLLFLVIFLKYNFLKYNLVNSFVCFLIIISVFAIFCILQNYHLYTLAFPETSWDALTYHIPIVKSIVNTHHVSLIKYIRYPIFPINGELLMLIPVSINWQLAKTIPFLMVFVICLTALVDIGLNKEKLSVNKTAIFGCIFAIILINTQIIYNFSTKSYIDITLSAVCFVSVVYMKQYIVNGNYRYFVISLLAYAIALGTKYSALLFLPMMIIGIVFALLRLTFKKFIITLILFTIISLIWYIRNYYFTGNPVWPFGYNFFGMNNDHIWNSSDYLGQFADLKRYSSNSYNVMSLIESTYLNHMSEGNGVYIGYWVPFLFLFTYICIIKLTRIKTLFLDGVWFYYGCVFVYILFWSRSVPNIRYLLPVIPIFILITIYNLFLLNKIKNLVFNSFCFISLLCCFIIYAFYDVEVRKNEYLYLRDHKIEEIIPVVNLLSNINKNEVYYGFIKGGAQLEAYADTSIYGDWFGFYRYSDFASNCNGMKPYLKKIGANGAIVEHGFIDNNCYSKCISLQGKRIEINGTKYCILESK